MPTDVLSARPAPHAAPLAEAVSRFIDRPQHPGLSLPKWRELRTETNSDALFSLLGALSFLVSPECSTLTAASKQRVAETVTETLDMAVASEGRQAARVAAACEGSVMSGVAR
jgi:hypothetical protein